MSWARVAILSLLLAPAVAHAEEARPLYEIEAVAIGAYTPDYPGSSQMHGHVLPLPWVVYRGGFLRTDERGSVRGRLIDTKRFGLDVSLNGSFPTDSTDNDARDGMADLDWLGEIGPKLRVTGYTWANEAQGRRARLGFELPVRAAFSTDFSSVEYRGIVANPALVYENQAGGTRVKLSVGPMFATSELMEYFYQVDAADVRAGRPAYQASAGYMGTRVGLRGVVPVGDRVKLLGSLNYDHLGGASNEDSPLMKETGNVGVMLGLSVSLYRSDSKAR